MQQQTPYQLIGGESTLARLCNRFYELMDSVPQFATMRALHPVELQSSQDKLYMFLSGWLGGPDLYVENIGHPMLRRRHLPFAIGESERDQWVACMVLAMESVGIEEPLREQLMLSFFNTADFLRNQ
ncbi:group II truncated hemoglobin [Accumulibacter sp.]|jgi:hemoglobin|uniref:group II truncated hemoglobin n=1 Tax=Accumulibacter sp. TaxID=2053492 RepID=UPI002C4CBA91|nr:group II truncated hemoglobin [Accumulibacter sp.]HPU78801.1 group II truncated hemoglobin [Accumulibacter sp.]